MIDLANAWNECVNLRDLLFLRCNPNHAEAIMALWRPLKEAKKHLKRLTINTAFDYEMAENDIKEMSDIFAQHTGHIEKNSCTMRSRSLG